MRRPFCTVLATAATLVLGACSSGSSVPTSPGPAASVTPVASASAPAPAPDGGKKSLTAADCPKVGSTIEPAGAPSVGKARHEEIIAIFQKHRDKFRCCYDVARQQNKALKGSYSIEVVLKPDGTIKQIMPQKANSEIQDQGMDDCAFVVARSLNFSPNSDGKETTIPYQFGFTPGGGR